MVMFSPYQFVYEFFCIIGFNIIYLVSSECLVNEATRPVVGIGVEIKVWSRPS